MEYDIRPVVGKDHVLDFGKYKGATIAEILESDPGYLIWLNKNTERFQLPNNILLSAALNKLNEADYDEDHFGGEDWPEWYDMEY